MPAEAIHLSALFDTRATADPEIARLLQVREREARLGAVLVDMPYFEGFTLEMFRYMSGRPPQTSAWGDHFHQVAPSRVGLELLRAAASARRHRQAITALALGYLSHVAVDGAMHPLVNRLARVRAERLGTTQSAEHREVEKFQSVLFHERRLGRGFMGTRELGRYIKVDAAALLADDALGAAVEDAYRQATGSAPARHQWISWAQGYRQYSWVLASPLGKLPAPPRKKSAARAEVYVAPQFEREYARAVERSVRYVRRGFAALEAGALDEVSFFAIIPEGSIDG